jgi:hypothetical protein
MIRCHACQTNWRISNSKYHNENRTKIIQNGPEHFAKFMFAAIFEYFGWTSPEIIISCVRKVFQLPVHDTLWFPGHSLVMVEGRLPHHGPLREPGVDMVRSHIRGLSEMIQDQSVASQSIWDGFRSGRIPDVTTACWMGRDCQEDGSGSGRIIRVVAIISTGQISRHVSMMEVMTMLQEKVFFQGRGSRAFCSSSDQ